jgi:putative drug exporter of the RND superfamily
MAAALPLAVGGLAIVGTFLVLEVLPASPGVDLRPQPDHRPGPRPGHRLQPVRRVPLPGGAAPTATIPRRRRPHRATAGRTVVFSSGLTVAVSLAALLVFPIAFLRSFAIRRHRGGRPGRLGAVVVLPALMACWAPHRQAVAAAASGPRRRRGRSGTGWPSRDAATAPDRHRGVVALLLLLGAPFLHITLGLPDDRVLPPRPTSERLPTPSATTRGPTSRVPLDVVAARRRPGRRRRRRRVRRRPLDGSGVARVDAATRHLRGRWAGRRAEATLVERFEPRGRHWLSVVPSVEPVSSERRGAGGRPSARWPSPPGRVGGRRPVGPAGRHQGPASRRLPLGAAHHRRGHLRGAVPHVRELLVPAQGARPQPAEPDGHLRRHGVDLPGRQPGGVLDFTATGALDTTMPILMFCIAFGLSMDYEVFLLSRIKEEHDARRQRGRRWPWAWSAPGGSSPPPRCS